MQESDSEVPEIVVRVLSPLAAVMTIGGVPLLFVTLLDLDPVLAWWFGGAVMSVAWWSYLLGGRNR